MNQSVMDKYDLCIIGCGPAGFSAAMKALDLNKRVCIVEGGEIGGAGVKWGALASKTLWELSKDYAVAARLDRGFCTSGLTVDFREVQGTVKSAVKEKQYQILSQIETFSERHGKFKGSLILKRGTGSFISGDELEVNYPDGNKEIVSSDYFLIATGSRPRQLPNIDVDQNQILDSDGIMELNKFPRRLLIVGAGIVGCEFATIFSSFGKTEVYLVDHREMILPYEDEDISDFVSTSLANNGVTIFHSAKLGNIVKKPDHIEAVLDFNDRHSEVIEVDAVLVSIGRVPEFSKLNLGAAGIELNERGFLDTDESGRVRGNIFAAGDVSNHPALVNIAEMEGRHAVKNMFKGKTGPLRYNNMTTIMFFQPEVAAVGLNEKQCREKEISYRVGYYSNALVGRAIAMRSTRGFVKLIVSDDEKQTILGMRAAGPQVSSTIMSIVISMNEGQGLTDILESVYPHPAMSESIQECIRLLLGKSMYKPEAFPELLRVEKWSPVK